MTVDKVKQFLVYQLTLLKGYGRNYFYFIRYLIGSLSENYSNHSKIVRVKSHFHHDIHKHIVRFTLHVLTFRRK